MSNYRARCELPDNLTIPTLPAVVARIQQMLSDPGTGTREIGEAIAEDAPLAAKVLRIANSAYYGMREPCVSPEQASSVLGVRVLRNVVMQAAVIRKFQHLANLGVDLDEIWRHAIQTAQACSYLSRRARMTEGMTPDDFHSCGLLHDLGRVVLLDALGEQYVEMMSRAQQQQLPPHVLELRELGYDHTDIGSVVATRWGLPKPVAEAVQYHHGPREAVEASPVVSLVANANLFVDRLNAGHVAGAIEVFDAATLAFLGLSTRDVEATVEHMSATAEALEV